jgi:DNA-binding transcriptional MerR regulator
MGSENSDLLRVGQAAVMLGIGPERVRQLSDRGDLPCIRGPYGRMYRVADVERLREAREGKCGVGDPRPKSK